MNQQRENTVVICGYGLFDPGFDFEAYRLREPQTNLKVRSKIEMEGLVQYLSHCADLITRLYFSDELQGIVLCGGYTNHKMPNVSEAETNLLALKQFLKLRGLPVENLIFCLEDGSFNTPQNLWFAVQSILGHRDKMPKCDEEGKSISSVKLKLRHEMKEDFLRLKGAPIIFVCDKYRHFKLWALNVRLLWDYPKIKARVMSFPRKDIHRMSSYPRQWLAGLWYLLSPSKLKEDLGVGQ